MEFRIISPRLKLKWIMRKAEEDTQKADNAALDRWISEGGLITEELSAPGKTRVFIYLGQRQEPPLDRNIRSPN